MPDEPPSSAANSNECCVLVDYVSSVIGKIPDSSERPQADSALRIRGLSNGAAIQAGVMSGALALPPGPLGWLTILPDIAGIWRIQAQLVADIAAVHGKKHLLTRENLLYCLFRHSNAQAVRELVVQVGERLLVRVGSATLLKTVVRRIGVTLSRRLVAESMARLLPLIGAVGVGTFAYFDTAEVARTAAQFFASDVSLEAVPAVIVALKAFNGLYVCSDFSRDAVLVADRSERLEWERFKLTPVEPGSASAGLQAVNQCWWCCDGDNGCRLVANKNALDVWETFKIERINESEVSLRAFNNFLVYADPERGCTLWADRERSGPTTVFKMEILTEENAS